MEAQKTPIDQSNLEEKEKKNAEVSTVRAFKLYYKLTKTE